MSGQRGKWRISAVLLCGVLALGLGSAQAKPTQIEDLRYFQGEAPHDKDSYLEFDAVMGKTRFIEVQRFYFTRVNADCKYGDETETAFVFKDPLKVGPSARFRGTDRARFGPLVVTVRVRGWFRPTGPATGSLRFRALGDTCNTRWRARPHDTTTP